MIDNTPPNDMHAEEHLIGCCIQSEKSFENIRGKVSLSDFYTAINSKIYGVICLMYDKKIGVNVEAIIRYSVEHKIDGFNMQYLNRIIDVAPIPSNALLYADIVIAKSKARALTCAAYNIMSIAQELKSDNTKHILIQAETIIGDVVRGYTGAVDYYDEAKYITDRDQQINGVPWGFRALDKWCNIPIGRAAYIGSISNGGKSTFMFNVAQSLAIRGHKVGIFTYEDSRFDGTIRMNYLYYMDILRTSRINMFPVGRIYNEMTFWQYRQKVKSNDNKFRDVDDVCRALSHENILFFDAPLKVNEIADHVKHILNEKKELSVIFLDYLQIIPCDDDDAGYIKLKNLVNGLNEIARRYRVGVVSACQMTVGEYDSEKNDYMKISRVRESRDIFHSCAVFLGLHNEAQFNSQQKGEETLSDIDNGCFDLLKNKTLEGVEKKNIPFKLERNRLKFNVTDIPNVDISGRAV